MLLIGMADDDEAVAAKVEGKPSRPPTGQNAWPAKYYAPVLTLAIEVRQRRALKELVANVNPGRIGLVGQILGAAGVLYAASHDARGIRAVAALNPDLVYWAGFRPAAFDNFRQWSFLDFDSHPEGVYLDRAAVYHR